MSFSYESNDDDDKPTNQPCIALQASLKDTETLFNALEWRLATIRAHQTRVNGSSSAAASSSSEAGEPTVSSPKRSFPAEAGDETDDASKKRRSE